MDIINIKIWGLLGAGKSELLDKVNTLQIQGVSFSQLGLDPRSPDTPSSLGIDVAIIQIDGVKFTQWDLGRQLQFRRSLWDIYTHPKDFGLIYVVDVSDPSRFHGARNHLCQILDVSPFREIPLAIFANNSNILTKRGESISEETLLQVLDCIKEEKITFKIFMISTTTGDGILEGVNWLKDVIQEKKQSSTID